MFPLYIWIWLCRLRWDLLCILYIVYTRNSKLVIMNRRDVWDSLLDFRESLFTIYLSNDHLLFIFLLHSYHFHSTSYHTKIHIHTILQVLSISSTYPYRFSQEPSQINPSSVQFQIIANYIQNACLIHDHFHTRSLPVSSMKLSSYLGASQTAIVYPPADSSLHCKQHDAEIPPGNKTKNSISSKHIPG